MNKGEIMRYFWRAMSATTMMAAISVIIFSNGILAGLGFLIVLFIYWTLGFLSFMEMNAGLGADLRENGHPKKCKCKQCVPF